MPAQDKLRDRSIRAAQAAARWFSAKKSVWGALLRIWWGKRIATIVYTTGFLSSTTNLLMSGRVQARFNGSSRVSDKILDNAVDQIKAPDSVNRSDSARCKIL
jgi:hypothetical protein